MRHSRESRHREKVDLLEAIALIVEREIRDAMIFADHLAPHTEFLNQSVALESVCVQRVAKLGLLRSEFADDVVNLRGREAVGAAGKLLGRTVCCWWALLGKTCGARAHQNQPN